ncbi:acyl-protein synthetase [Phaeobacter sp. B1627]|uniref:LuxE/PaaK family acyltransferase n=1 Tax=Phaeobacter sp. B1627 TaxID=2583809 RepID=UPI00111A9233|nr:acyl-protein synthetase [Phaeobacter sp. B1627]TNJ42318.1 acyl-protein synthetase [Phaeobacter sp. B1627]
MITLDRNDVFSLAPFGQGKSWKRTQFLELMQELTEHHARSCPEYARMLVAANCRAPSFQALEDVPFVPANIFKLLSLASVPPEEVSRTLVSSGTTGGPRSRVMLDQSTAMDQLRALLCTLGVLAGRKSVPVLILDSPNTLADPTDSRVSGRAGGVQGFSMLGKFRSFALDHDLKLDPGAIHAFLERTDGDRYLVYGFTSIIYGHVIEPLLRSSQRFDLAQGILVHGGGWKTLAARNIGDAQFRADVAAVSGLTRIHNYYGMVEQMGSIFLECEQGHLHTSCFSDILFRRPRDFSVCGPGETGIAQVMSVLPRSYPGHSLLTEDEGMLLGEDDCPCGWSGKYFRIFGRLEAADAKGCGDVDGYARAS